MELPTLGETIRQAMALRESTYVEIQQSPRGLWMALMVVSIAGLSQAFGQSLVLFINHVRPRRFILAVLVSVVSYVLGYVLWAASVWLVGVYAFGVDVGWMSVAAAVGLAYAPQVLAFFELTPFLGNPFGILLSLWTLVAILIALRAGLELEMWEAAATAGLGWLLLQLWRRTLGRPIYRLGQWVERIAAGVPLRYRVQDLARLQRRPKWLRNVEEWRHRLQLEHAGASHRERDPDEPGGDEPETEPDGAGLDPGPNVPDSSVSASETSHPATSPDVTEQEQEPDLAADVQDRDERMG